MIQARQFSSVEDLQAHYRAVRSRLNAGMPAQQAASLPVRVPTPFPVAIKIEVKPAEPEPELDAPFEPEPGMDGARRAIAYIARAHGFTSQDIYGPRKCHPLVAARHEAIALVAKLNPSWSLPQIGRVFKRDHTTILHAIRKMESRS